MTENEKIEIITRVHAECGHSGITATYIALVGIYSWPNLYKDVKKFVEECSTCKNFSKGNKNIQKYRIPLKNIFDSFGIDLIGPLPKTLNGNKYIISCIDLYSRYLETSAIKNKESKTVANFLIEKIFLKYGNPSQILTDQGKEFNNSLIKDICTIMKSKKTFTSSYHPECNGGSERSNGTLIGKLAKLCNGEYIEWDEKLPYATFAYNISFNTRTNLSPYQILFGQPYQFKENEKIYIFEESNDYLSRILDLRGRMKDIIINERSKTMEKLKKGITAEDLEIGDMVMKRKQGPEKGNKLDSKWQGPYKIIKKAQLGNYHIQDWSGKIFSVNRKDIQITDSDLSEYIYDSFSKEGGMWYSRTTLINE